METSNALQLWGWQMRWIILFLLLAGPVKSRAMDVYEALTWHHPHGTLHGPVFGEHREFFRELFDFPWPHHEHGCRPPAVPVSGALWLFISSFAGLSVILRRR